MDRKLEVLAPAGDMERLTMAVASGADAVYMAGKQFGMRAAAGNFAGDDMRSAIKYCHDNGVKAHITCNTLPRNKEIDELPEYLEFLQDAGADAIIAADMGVITMAKKYAPKVSLHVSTQFGIVNYASANALYDMGADRVILARELSFEDIRELRSRIPKELEVEAFGHGSMCVSFSGRCLLSNYLTGRDANRGACAQPCRWKYHVVEETRPGEYMEITEDKGTYLFNSKDMCMIDHLDEFIDSGIDSIKIEGRMKSAYYTAVVTNAYRHAADAAIAGRPLEKVWHDEVYKISHREYSTGFFYDSEGPGQYYDDAHYFTDSDVIAVVESCDEEGNAVLTQRNKFAVGDKITLLTPDDEPVTFDVEYMENGSGEAITQAPHPMMELKMKLPIPTARYSVLRKDKVKG